MPRIGINPMKHHGRPWQPQRVTLITAVHIPELAGYWAESLDVLKVCLESVFQATTQPYDLLVWDNASCAPVRQYLRQLHDEGQIQFLVEARENAGKVGCWNMALPAAPGELIAWFDSDVLFAPGWLEESLRVFDLFPDVGMVTARPLRPDRGGNDDLISATLHYAEHAPPEVAVERGALIPQEYIAEHLRSRGRDESSTEAQVDVKMTRNELSVYAHANHFQFVTRKELALQVLPLPIGTHPLGADRGWDCGINSLGCLRLGLADCYVRHLGNTLAQGNAAAASPNRAALHRPAAPARMRTPGVLRKLAVRFHAALGRWLYS